MWVGVNLIFISKIKVSQVDPVACIQELKYENPTHMQVIQTVGYGHKTWPLEFDPYRRVFRMWL